MKTHRKLSMAALMLGAAVTSSLSACNNPHGQGTGTGVLSTSGFTDDTSASGAVDISGAVDETGGADTTGGDTTGGVEVSPCSFDGMLGAYESVFDASGFLQVPLSEVQFTVNAQAVCGDVPELVSLQTDLNLGEYNVYVYRPWDATTNWPSDPEFPVVFFAPGNQLEIVPRTGTPDLTDATNHYYRHLVEPLSQDGHIVIAIQTPFVSSSELRRKMFACTMIWARESWSEASRVSTSAVLAGHSRGGSAVNMLVDTLYDTDEDGEIDDLSSGSAVDDYEICATVSIAQRWGPDTQSDTRTNIDVLNPDASPALSILGARDNDTVAQQVSMFDARAPEEVITQGGNVDASLDTHPEAMVVAYGPQHNAWGGVDGSSVGDDIAHAVGPHYVREFLRWHVLGEISGRQAFVDLADPTLTEMDLPSTVSTPSDWTDNCDLCPFYDGCQVAGAACDGPPAVPATLAGLGRPVIYAALTEGHGSGGADRFVVDTLTRSQAGSGTSLGDSTIGGSVEVVSGGGGVASWDWAATLTSGLGLAAWNGHLSSAVRLDWGGDDNDIQVLWSLDDDEGMQLPGVGGLGAYTHVSLRIGNVVEGDAGCDQAAAELSFDEVEGDLRLHYRDGSGTDQTTGWTSIGVLVDPQRPFQYNQSTQEIQCDAVQLMHTVRLPLADFCASEGLSIQNLSGIELRLVDKGVPQHAIVDSIEFTRDPAAAGTEACPTETSGWNCYAASSFTATETSCSGEPTPTCAPGDVVTSSVAVPWVDNPGGGGFFGWVAHMPAGWISSPSNPTQTDRDRVLDACIDACMLEWSDDPDVGANCSTSAFSSVALRQSPDRGPVQRIPASQESGGFFGGQQLSCSLESDCCLQFDEDLCRARPVRPTSATIPIGVGEEYRVSFSAVSKATFTTPGGSVITPLAGTAGYSHCADASSGTCPFYLGSATASATSTVTVADTCPDSSSFSAVVSDLDLELLQPAFGQADSGSYDKVMPVGALLLQGTVTIDGATYTVHATNEDPVELAAAGGWLFALDMQLQLDVPCGDSTLPLTLEIDLQRGTTLQSPPSVSIGVPSTVTCPSSVPLSATASDPDSDLASIRWYVDDVLISSSTSSVPFTQDHTLRVVARDARGATTTATKKVACL